MAPKTVDLIEGRAGDDFQRRIEREMSDEYGEPAKHHAFQFGQEPEAPVQRGLQRLLTRRRGARPEPQQGQTLIEKRGGLLQAVGFDASGRQFDRERHAVELSADARDDRGFRIADVQTRATCHRALDEQLRGRERLDNRRREPRVVRRTGKRIQSVDMLALDPKRLAARRQDVDLRCRLDDACRQRRHRFDEMLAGIEDQKNSLVAQIGDQIGRRIVRLNRQPQHGGDGRRHQVGIAEHSEIDEQHGARESLDQVMSDRDRNRGLADAAGADDGDKARSVQLSRQLENVVIPADHSAQAAGKIGVRKIGGNDRRIIARTARPRDRRDEAIAPPGKGRDVSRAILSIAQRLAEAGHVKPQAAFFDDDVGPDPRHQILLADDFVRRGDQDDQNVERARAQLDGDALFCEEPFARHQMEGTKRQSVFGLPLSSWRLLSEPPAPGRSLGQGLPAAP